MEPTAPLRPLALLTAPAVAASLALVVVAVATSGGDPEASPFAVASTALVLTALLGVAALAAMLLGRVGTAGPAVALLGSVLVAGGQWASLFVLPQLSTAAPGLLASGRLTAVTVGFVASYAVLAVGWVSTAVAAVRSGAVPRWLGVLLAVGAVLSVVPAPEPVRLLVLAIGVSLTARRLAVVPRDAAVALPTV